MSKPGKITAEKLIEDRQGIEKLIKDFKDIELLEKDQELDAFRKVIQIYQIWAATLSVQNVLDFARNVEGALAGDVMRQHLLNYRVDHLRREGIFAISEEEMRKQKAEVNKQRALAKHRQMEEEKLRAQKERAAQNDEIENDQSGSSSSENDSMIDDN